MKGGMLGGGPAHANGSRLFAQPAPGAIGKSRSTQVFPRGAPDPPDFAGAGAPCTRPDVDEDLWHPNGSGAAERVQAAEAIALCVQCPMRVECRGWADAIKATHGIWGGEWLDFSDLKRSAS